MDFIDEVRSLGERALDMKDELETEEATKNALIMPFIRLLGYDVFDPREVKPEFTADIGTKKGEKVDYAIFKDGSPTILFECKASSVQLGKAHTSQLYRYFSAVKEIRFGVLTNGIIYRFFSDIETDNVMDDKPFFEFSLFDIRESLISELKKFAKDNFDIDNILTTASELKYTREIKAVLAAEYDKPTEDFIRLCIDDVYSGRVTQQVLEQFETITRRAFHQFVNDHINTRLKSALANDENDIAADDPVDADDAEGDARIVTTEEEYEGYFAVKAVLHNIVDLSRIAMRDRVSYCGILLDDSNRKPICRLHFNKAQKYLGVFDENKKEHRHKIDSIDCIYDFSDTLEATCRMYDGPAVEEEIEEEVERKEVVIK